MSKFTIGDEVENAADDHEVGTVVAVFPTDDGKFRYAVDTARPILDSNSPATQSRLLGTTEGTS